MKPYNKKNKNQYFLKGQRIDPQMQVSRVSEMLSANSLLALQKVLEKQGGKK